MDKQYTLDNSIKIVHGTMRTVYELNKECWYIINALFILSFFLLPSAPYILSISWFIVFIPPLPYNFTIYICRELRMANMAIILPYVCDCNIPPPYLYMVIDI